MLNLGTSAEDILHINDAVISLDKSFIEIIKKADATQIRRLFQNNNLNTSSLIFILKNMGYLPLSFDYDVFIGLLNHINEDVRYWAVKNIGKSKSERYYEILAEKFRFEHSTMVKREIVSSIGRMRSKKTIPLLSETLSNEDPKIVSQAVRALLCFKGEKQVDEELIKLVNHENEVIRTVIYKEYFSVNTCSKSTQPHTESYDYLKNVVVNGDVLNVLPLLKNESVHLTFTSPPYYNARDYSIYPSYDAYLNFLKKVFEETFRITKEGRFLIVNTSPIIVPRISRAHSSKRYPIPFDLHTILTKMGWEFIDDIVWVKPEYSVKNRIGGFQQHRKPLAYKPNSITEYLMVYRKQTDKLLDWNMRQYPYTTIESSKVTGDFETTNVWKICPKSDKIHSAVFPEELCKRVIEYYSYQGDLVFDPFAGSGTFGRTAKKLKRYFFLTEKNVEYFEYMKQMKQMKSNTCYSEKYETKFYSINEFKESIEI